MGPFPVAGRFYAAFWPDSTIENICIVTLSDRICCLTIAMESNCNLNYDHGQLEWSPVSGTTTRLFCYLIEEECIMGNVSQLTSL